MRRLILLPLAIVATWMAYWATGAIVLERTITGWLDTRTDEGWVAERSDVGVSGFPTRFDVRIGDLELADPDTGVAWQAPEFRFDAATIRPTRITATWPAEQTIASPFERITIVSDRMQGQIEFEANTALAVRAADIDLSSVRATSTLGWTAALAAGSLKTTQSELAEDAHDLLFEATDLSLSEPARRLLDPTRALPNEISVLRLDAFVDFNAPWDRFAIERARPQIEAIDLRDVRATWGNLDLRAAGELTVDAEGVPTGRVTVKATNWREMLAIAEATGAVPESMVPTVERGLELLASLSGPADTLDAPLSFQNGFVSFGPIPLGPAPRLTLR